MRIILFVWSYNARKLSNERKLLSHSICSNSENILKKLFDLITRLELHSDSSEYIHKCVMKYFIST
jgi:hypothetical protein